MYRVPRRAFSIGPGCVVTASGSGIRAIATSRTDVEETTSVMDQLGLDPCAKGRASNENAAGKDTANQTVVAITSSIIWVDKAKAVSHMVDALTELPTKTPSIYVNLKGVNLGRDGAITILQIFIHPTRKTYLLDVQSLEHTAFTIPGKAGQTLKDILESPLIPKVFFDVRRGADALFALFDIGLYGVLDLQLMEFATRDDVRGRGRFVRRPEKCVMFHSPLSPKEKIKWEKTENQGRHLFAPHLGGSCQILAERPLRRDVVNYCVHDVSVMPGLWAHYSSKMTPEWMNKVVVASRERVWTSNAIEYYPMGRLMALAPLSFLLPQGCKGGKGSPTYHYFSLTHFSYHHRCYQVYCGIATDDATDANAMIGAPSSASATNTNGAGDVVDAV